MSPMAFARYLARFALVVAALAWPRQAAAQADSAAVAASRLALDGLDIEFDDKGNWLRMYSTYRETVRFPDRQGINRAYRVAQEKGKAQIVRFFEENVTSERLIQEVDRESQRALRQESDSSETFNRNTQREMVSSVSEFTRSYSRGTLRGVTVIEQGYDETAEEVWVKIGLSRSTVALGAQMQRDIANPTARGSASDSTKRTIRQPSEVRTRIP